MKQKTKKQLEKEIERLNVDYRNKTILHKEYLQQIIPLLDEYKKCKGLTMIEKTKLNTLSVTLKALKFIK